MLILGAKGFAKELLAVIRLNGDDQQISFFDDITPDPPQLLYGQYPIITSFEAAEKYLQTIDNRFVLGTGGPQTRWNLAEKFLQCSSQMHGIVAQTALISDLNNQIGYGTSIMSNVVIEADNSIGDGCLIHVGAFISHDIKIGNFCEISPYVKLLGGVSVGDYSSLGTGCVVLPRVKIGRNVAVGANAVVTRDIDDDKTVVGVPAKPLVK